MRNHVDVGKSKFYNNYIVDDHEILLEVKKNDFEYVAQWKTMYNKYAW